MHDGRPKKPAQPARLVVEVPAEFMTELKKGPRPRTARVASLVRTALRKYLAEQTDR